MRQPDGVLTRALFYIHTDSLSTKKMSLGSIYRRQEHDAQANKKPWELLTADSAREAQRSGACGGWGPVSTIAVNVPQLPLLSEH